MLPLLESLAVIYRNDAISRERKLSPTARLEFHQAESGPTMAELQAWLTRQFEDRLVEPNSSLGGAIAYMLKHWERLTLFLRVPGAPLDNNICERALKKAILHRKNALFYKTENGAHVGDIFIESETSARVGETAAGSQGSRGNDDGGNHLDDPVVDQGGYLDGRAVEKHALCA